MIFSGAHKTKTTKKTKIFRKKLPFFHSPTKGIFKVEISYDNQLVTVNIRDLDGSSIGIAPNEIWGMKIIRKIEEGDIYEALVQHKMQGFQAVKPEIIEFREASILTPDSTTHGVCHSQVSEVIDEPLVINRITSGNNDVDEHGDVTLPKDSEFDSSNSTQKSTNSASSSESQYKNIVAPKDLIRKVKVDSTFNGYITHVDEQTCLFYVANTKMLRERNQLEHALKTLYDSVHDRYDTEATDMYENFQARKKFKVPLEQEYCLLACQPDDSSSETTFIRAKVLKAPKLTEEIFVIGNKDHTGNTIESTSGRPGNVFAIDYGVLLKDVDGTKMYPIDPKFYSNLVGCNAYADLVGTSSCVFECCLYSNASLIYDYCADKWEPNPYKVNVENIQSEQVRIEFLYVVICNHHGAHHPQYGVEILSIELADESLLNRELHPMKIAENDNLKALSKNTRHKLYKRAVNKLKNFKLDAAARINFTEKPFLSNNALRLVFYQSNEMRANACMLERYLRCSAADFERINPEDLRVGDYCIAKFPPKVNKNNLGSRKVLQNTRMHDRLGHPGTYARVECIDKSGQGGLKMNPIDLARWPERISWNQPLYNLNLETARYPACMQVIKISESACFRLQIGNYQYQNNGNTIPPEHLCFKRYEQSDPQGRSRSSHNQYVALFGIDNEMSRDSACNISNSNSKKSSSENKENEILSPQQTEKVLSSSNDSGVNNPKTPSTPFQKLSDCIQNSPGSAKTKTLSIKLVTRMNASPKCTPKKHAAPQRGHKPNLGTPKNFATNIATNIVSNLCHGVKRKASDAKLKNPSDKSFDSPEFGRTESKLLNFAEEDHQVEVLKIPEINIEVTTPNEKSRNLSSCEDMQKSHVSVSYFENSKNDVVDLPVDQSKFDIFIDESSSHQNMS